MVSREPEEELYILASGKHKIRSYVDICHNRFEKGARRVVLCGNFAALEKVIAVSEIVKRTHQGVNSTVTDQVAIIHLEVSMYVCVYVCMPFKALTAFFK